jgi:acyl dehydratase
VSGERSGTGAVPELYYQDFEVGRSFDLGVLAVDPAEMRAFATRFDPQWYHLDADAARAGGYRDTIASGFFTTSLFMRSYVDTVLSRAAAAASPGVEELRWTAPVYGGDRLTGRLEVLDRKLSAARPGLGTVTLAATLTRLTGLGEPAEDVLRIRFRGWFHLRGR